MTYNNQSITDEITLIDESTLIKLTNPNNSGLISFSYTSPEPPPTSQHKIVASIDTTTYSFGNISGKLSDILKISPNEGSYMASQVFPIFNFTVLALFPPRIPRGVRHFMPGQKYYYEKEFPDESTVYMTQSCWDITERVGVDSKGAYMLIKSNIFGKFNYSLVKGGSGGIKYNYQAYIFPQQIQVISQNSLCSSGDFIDLLLDANNALRDNKIQTTIINSFSDATIKISPVID